MIAAGHDSFYKIEGGKKLAYDPLSKSYQQIPAAMSLLY
jgi:3-hydroxyacyl-CoA dehydrogenase